MSAPREMVIDEAELRRIVETPPLHAWLGLRLTEARAGEVVIELPYRPELLATPEPENGYVHGGILATLLDLAGDFALATLAASPRSTCGWTTCAPPCPSGPSWRRAPWCAAAAGSASPTPAWSTRRTVASSRSPAGPGRRAEPGGGRRTAGSPRRRQPRAARRATKRSWNARDEYVSPLFCRIAKATWRPAFVVQ
jgi:hypothetical protein